MTGPRPAGRPWTRADDNQLRVLLNSGMKAALIAQKMKRTIGAHPFSKEHAEGKREMKQAKPPPDHTVLKIGDRVRLASGTLTWSPEMTLQGKIGDVIECSDDGAATKRVTVRFPNGRLLTSRNVGMFEIV
jgi:hypothetical protein